MEPDPNSPITPSLQSFVLVSANARVDRPKRFDASRVIKTDQLKKAIWRDIDGENPILGLLKTATKIVSSETVEHVARQLAGLHVPVRGTASPIAAPRERAAPAPRGAQPRNEPTIGPTAPAAAHPPRNDATPKPPRANGPRCKSCETSSGTVLYGRYGDYFKCGQCSANTAIRFSCEPGHNPRLRKDGQRFYRECAGCGSSELYFTNPAQERT